jgi:hypothetical protein
VRRYAQTSSGLMLLLYRPYIFAQSVYSIEGVSGACTGVMANGRTPLVLRARRMSGCAERTTGERGIRDT